MLLFQALVKRADELIEAGRPHDMPFVTYGDARVVMTRTDFLDSLDRLSLISMCVRFPLAPLTATATRSTVSGPTAGSC